MAFAYGDKLVEIAADLVPLAAEGCTIDLFGVRGRECVAATHVQPGVAKRLRTVDGRAGFVAQARASIVIDDAPVGEVIAWCSRTLSPLEEALVCAAAAQARAVLEAHEASRRADEAEASRRALLAMVGHEVRAPLQAATIGLELVQMRVQDAADDVPRAWLTERCERLARTLARLRDVADRLLDVSVAEGGALRVEPTEGDLRQIALSVIASMQDEVAWAGCTVDVEVRPRDAALVGAWDRVHLETMLQNLLSNAIKFGAGQPVVVVLEGREEDVRVTVRDRGPGLAPADLPHVFDAFYRGSASANLPGLGVGLAIVRRLAEAHGGRVSCEPAQRGGASFTVTLPRVSGVTDPGRGPSRSRAGADPQ